MGSIFNSFGDRLFLPRPPFGGLDAVMLCFDLARRHSFETLQGLMRRWRRLRSSTTAPLFIVGIANCEDEDVAEASTRPEESLAGQARCLAEEYGGMFLVASTLLVYELECVL